MKYKLNETVKQKIREQGFPNNIELEGIDDSIRWINAGFDLGHLVEVPERIEVDACSYKGQPAPGTGCYLLCKADKSDWSADEMAKVESALNGEVLTLEQIREGYEEWGGARPGENMVLAFIDFLKSKFQ
jgi:hypothetical protein